jgi:hypothetical protein
MMGRFVDHGIRILAASALLAVMSSPIRPTRASHTAPSPYYLLRNLVILNNGYSGQFATPARPSSRSSRFRSLVQQRVRPRADNEGDSQTLGRPRKPQLVGSTVVVRVTYRALKDGPPPLREVDALQSAIEDGLDADIEDELTVTSPSASVSFDVLPPPCREPYTKRVSFAVALAARPLRC